MNLRLSRATAFLSGCFLAGLQLPSPLPAEEGRGRELIEGILDAILDAKRAEERPTMPERERAIDLPAFRSNLAEFGRELNRLARSVGDAPRGSAVRGLLPALTQLQSRVDYAQSDLAEERDPSGFDRHFGTIEEEWDDISNRLRGLPELDRAIWNATVRLDGLAADLAANLGLPEAAREPSRGPGVPGGPDPRLVADLVRREIAALYRDISLQDLLEQSPAERRDLLDAAERLANAGQQFDGELSRNPASAALGAAYDDYRQAWTALESLLRNRQNGDLRFRREEIESQFDELARTLKNAGASSRFPARNGRPGAPAEDRQLLLLSSQLATLAEELDDAVRRDSRYFRNSRLSEQVSRQADAFDDAAKEFRLALVEPRDGRDGRVDTDALLDSWSETEEAWNRLDSGLDEVAQDVRRAERFFPDLFRLRQEIADTLASLGSILP